MATMRLGLNFTTMFNSDKKTAIGYILIAVISYFTTSHIGDYSIINNKCNNY